MAGVICPGIGNRSSGIVCIHGGWDQTEKKGGTRVGGSFLAGVWKSKGWVGFTEIGIYGSGVIKKATCIFGDQKSIGGTFGGTSPTK